MPTGPHIRRRADTGFLGEVRDMSAYYWMEWITSESGKPIQHELNFGRKKRVGPFPVDGYCAERNTIFQFHGFFFHGHDCVMTKKMLKVKSGIKPNQAVTRKQRT